MLKGCGGLSEKIGLKVSLSGVQKWWKSPNRTWAEQIMIQESRSLQPKLEDDQTQY